MIEAAAEVFRLFATFLFLGAAFLALAFTFVLVLALAFTFALVFVFLATVFRLLLRAAGFLFLAAVVLRAVFFLRLIIFSSVVQGQKSQTGSVFTNLQSKTGNPRHSLNHPYKLKYTYFRI